MNEWMNKISYYFSINLYKLFVYIIKKISIEQ